MARYQGLVRITFVVTCTCEAKSFEVGVGGVRDIAKGVRLSEHPSSHVAVSILPDIEVLQVSLLQEEEADSG